MQIINTAHEFQQLRKTLLGSIGFVATMGNLHGGHESLLIRSKRENAITVLSIFINPRQFNDADDFQRYPKTLDKDCEIANQLNVDYLFLPTVSDIYPENDHYKLTESKDTMILEGLFRPGHFEGMLTIVLKLLLILRPTRAYFGEKDYQQFSLVKNMAKAFFLETNIVGCPTIRNAQGLPLSSRNYRLTTEEFERAQLFPQIFQSTLSCEEASEALTSKGFEVEYIKEVDHRRYAAVKIGDIRLIDNIPLEAI